MAQRAHDSFLSTLARQLTRCGYAVQLTLIRIYQRFTLRLTPGQVRPSRPEPQLLRSYEVEVYIA